MKNFLRIIAISTVVILATTSCNDALEEITKSKDIESLKEGSVLKNGEDDDDKGTPG